MRSGAGMVPAPNSRDSSSSAGRMAPLGNQHATKCESGHGSARMTVPSIDILLIAGRAVFLLFSFVFAAIAFTAWRRTTQQQTQHLLTHTDLVLQRLAHLEARVDATKLSVSELGARVERPTEPAAPPAAAAP